MKHLLSIAIVTFILVSCQKETNNLFISGNIKGLKKGTVYLQKVGDSSLVNIDSVQISGSSEFVFSTFIEEPQIMFIELERNTGDDYAELVNFFAEPGEISLTTSLKNYGMDLEIVSNFENQKKLEEYTEVIKRFNTDRLDLIEANFNASQDQDEGKLDSINDKFNKILLRKYLYTVNFAINNKNLEISPYVILYEAFDANIKYLDTVYNALEKPIQKSMYGNQLKELIEERKKNENQNLETEVIDNISKE